MRLGLQWLLTARTSLTMREMYEVLWSVMTVPPPVKRRITGTRFLRLVMLTRANVAWYSAPYRLHFAILITWLGFADIPITIWGVASPSNSTSLQRETKIFRCCQCCRLGTDQLPESARITASSRSNAS